MNTVLKGDIAEAAVASDILKQGYQIALPFSSSSDWDLLLLRDSKFERVQVKYAEETSTGVVPVRSRTHSNTSAKTTSRNYTSEEIDWLAVYCPNTDQCYYVKASELTGNILHLRVKPSKNNQTGKVRWAADYTKLTPVV